MGMGRMAEAETLFVDILHDSERVLGKDHRETWNCRETLAYLYLMAGEYSVARRMYEEVLERRRRTEGEDHPLSLASLENLSHLHNAQGEYHQALLYSQDCLKRRIRLYGRDDELTIGIEISVARSYMGLEEYTKAENLLLDCVRRAKLSGKDTPRLLRSLDILGQLYLKQGKSRKAEKILADALEGRRRLFGDDHPGTLSASTRLLALQEQRRDRLPPPKKCKRYLATMHTLHTSFLFPILLLLLLTPPTTPIRVKRLPDPRAPKTSPQPSPPRNAIPSPGPSPRDPCIITGCDRTICRDRVRFENAPEPVCPPGSTNTTLRECYKYAACEIGATNHCVWKLPEESEECLRRVGGAGSGRDEEGRVGVLGREEVRQGHVEVQKEL
ncbi:hypothetical protein HDV00_010002 [Rhizophlyctis rosea]|nr:hypothetical protein HDV00_010002 [Rhizophlyctis rosea]